MLRFSRPPVHADFAADADISSARADVAARIGRGERPSFPDHWGKQKYKRAFTTAQRDKCGYCELKIGAGQPGDVEHYAPKSEVGRLDAPGREIDGLANVRDRRVPALTDAAGEKYTGYWWLAYEWSNYLIACNRCNTAWKKTLFPVQEDPRSLPPAPGVPETPLLLNPFDDDPTEHLHFSKLGQVKPDDCTDRGRATIDVCGLDRPSLVRARADMAGDVYRVVWEYYEASENPFATTDDALMDLIRLGEPTRAHAGTARSIIYHLLGVTWEDLIDAARGSGSM